MVLCGSEHGTQSADDQKGIFKGYLQSTDGKKSKTKTQIANTKSASTTFD